MEREGWWGVREDRMGWRGKGRKVGGWTDGSEDTEVKGGEERREEGSSG